MSITKFGDVGERRGSEFSANLQMAGISTDKPAAVDPSIQKMEGVLRTLGSPDPKRSAEFIAEIAKIADPKDLPGIVQNELNNTIKNPVIAAEFPRIADNLSRMATGAPEMAEAAPVRMQPATPSSPKM